VGRTLRESRRAGGRSGASSFGAFAPPCARLAAVAPAPSFEPPDGPLGSGRPECVLARSRALAATGPRGRRPCVPLYARRRGSPSTGSATSSTEPAYRLLLRPRRAACERPRPRTGTLTPARRAFERPIAIACFVDRAPCLPLRTCSISSRTNSPAWVDGAFPCRRSLRALRRVSRSGIAFLLGSLAGAKYRGPRENDCGRVLTPKRLPPHREGCGTMRRVVTSATERERRTARLAKQNPPSCVGARGSGRRGDYLPRRLSRDVVDSPTVPLLLFVTGEPDSGEDPLRDVETSVFNRFTGVMLGGAIAGTPAERHDRKRPAPDPFHETPGWHLPSSQQQCALLVLSVAPRTGWAVNVVDVNRPGEQRGLVERWVRPTDVFPFLLRPDGARLEGQEQFNPATLRRFLRRPRRAVGPFER
jgi:hypothetical protein